MTSIELPTDRHRKALAFKQERHTDRAGAIRWHYENAMQKHPLFATYIMYNLPEDPHTLDEMAEAYRKDAKAIKGMLPTEPSAQLVLEGELDEMYDAICRGDLRQARYEIYDVIAVLLRLSNNLQALHEADIQNDNELKKQRQEAKDNGDEPTKP